MSNLYQITLDDDGRSRQSRRQQSGPMGDVYAGDNSTISDITNDHALRPRFENKNHDNDNDIPLSVPPPPTLPVVEDEPSDFESLDYSMSSAGVRQQQQQQPTSSSVSIPEDEEVQLESTAGTTSPTHSWTTNRSRVSAARQGQAVPTAPPEEEEQLDSPPNKQTESQESEEEIIVAEVAYCTATTSPPSSPNAQNDSPQEPQKESCSKKPWLIAAVVLAIVVVVIAIVVPVLVLKDDNDDDDDNNKLNAQEALKDYLSSVALDGGTSLRDPTTPQGKAVDWLATNENVEHLAFFRLVQRYSLATLYYSTNGPQWQQSTGWLSDQHECNWYPNQTTCTTDGTTIDVIDLSINNLQGRLPWEELVLLSNLSRIVFYDNAAGGSLSRHLQRLSESLIFLDLYSNLLSGTLPTELGTLTNLLEFFVEANQLSGSLPTELGLMTSVRTMHLQDNFLYGTIPSELGNLVQLERLNVTGNPGLTGTMPLEICNLNLQVLEVDCNRVICSCCSNCGGPEGPESSSLDDLIVYLSNLSLDNGAAVQTPSSPQGRAAQWLHNNANYLSFSAATIVQRYTLATLYYMTLGETWTIQDGWLTDADECDWYSQQTATICTTNGEMALIDLTDNNLQGFLPWNELVLLKDHLLLIDIFRNQVNGQIPTEIGLLTNLISLDMYANLLEGTIPTELGLLTTLTYQDFDSNQLSGTIISEYGDMTALSILWLNNNNFTGTVPSELGRLINLQELYLEGNSGLSGPIPQEICDLNLDVLRADCTITPCDCCTECV